MMSDQDPLAPTAHCHTVATGAFVTQWDRTHKVTLWDPHGDDCATFERARIHSEERKLKLHCDTLAESDIPLDPSGYHCLVSVSSGDIEGRTRPADTALETVVTTVSNRGRHKVLELGP